MLFVPKTKSRNNRVPAKCWRFSPERCALFRVRFPLRFPITRAAFAIPRRKLGLALDSVAFQFAVVLGSHFVTVKFASHLEGNVLPRDLSIFDLCIIVSARNLPGKFIAILLEFQGNIAGLAVLAGKSPGPRAGGIRFLVLGAAIRADKCQ